MRKYKKLIWTLIGLEYLFTYLLFAWNTHSFTEPFVQLGTWLIPLFIVVPSFLVSMLLIVLFYKDGREYKTIFVCQLIGLAMGLGIWSWELYSDWRQDKYYGNIEYNNWLIEYPDDIDKTVLKEALSKLEQKFENPNDIRLISHWISKQDSLVGALTQTYYTIYFTYHVGGDTSRKYFSKLTAFDKDYQLALLNAQPENNKEYFLVLQQKEDEKQAVLHEVVEDVLQNKDMRADSINNKLKKIYAY